MTPHGHLDRRPCPKVLLETLTLFLSLLSRLPQRQPPTSVRSLRVGRAGLPVFSQPIAGDGPRHPPALQSTHGRPPSWGPLSTGWLSCSWGGDGHPFPCGCRTPPSTGNLSGPAVPTYLHSAHTRSHTCTHICFCVCPDTRHPTRAQMHPLMCAYSTHDILAHVCGIIRAHMTCSHTNCILSHTGSRIC